ncbi:MAG: AbrB family transcriptional regulator [Pseudomonadota bacterium]
MSPASPFLHLFLTLAISAFGGAVGQAAGVPAGILIGSTAAVTLAALSRRVPLFLPTGVRDIGFLMIGLSMGSGVTPDTLALMARWPVSFLMLTLSAGVTLVIVMQLLVRFYRIDAETAFLGATPGALSYAIALAEDGRADPAMVGALQSLRLLLLTALLPFVIGGLEGAATLGTADAPQPVLTLLEVALLLAISAGLGHGLGRLGMPAAMLIAGLGLSAVCHATGLVSGPPPDLMQAAALVIVGALLGTRFVGMSLSILRRLIGAALVIFVLSSSLAALAAMGTARWLDLPFAQVWVAYAPGGVEAMSAMALALGYDPVFIAAHHLYRIFAMIAILPIFYRWVGGR